ncbi:recombination-associated protein RdgC [Endozoicomonas atrinae]|uniref:recombination-associated protein RdgC n=1 Tax=Endozoicomonas atrinae TaxID=1333660 RepID=UPI0008249D29|nr:recombination-associated protein RdgC [Endozoicomonas atrinae]
MWFKNLNVYQFTEDFTLTGEALEEALRQNGAFIPCGPQDMSRYGFVSALGHRTEALVHQNNACMLIRARKEEKILPNEVINEKLAEKIEQIEQNEDRQVFAKEKKCIKEDIVMELLPQAFTRSKYTHAYIDLVRNLLIVNGSAKQAEELTSKLREALGSLPVLPPQTKTFPATCMSDWLKTQELPRPLLLGDQCELREPGEEGAHLKAKQFDLINGSIEPHLKDGMLVCSLLLTWQDSLTFTLNENLRLTGMTMTDVLLAERDETETDTKLEALDADFALMTGTFRKFLPQLFSYMN